MSVMVTVATELVELCHHVLSNAASVSLLPSFNCMASLAVTFTKKKQHTEQISYNISVLLNSCRRWRKIDKCAEDIYCTEPFTNSPHGIEKPNINQPHEELSLIHI